MKRFELTKLPYNLEDLEPCISKMTMEYHYGKHHKAYVDNLNRLIEGTEFEQMSLEDIVRKSKGAVFNNAAQVWNHDFYWNCLCPKSDSKPCGCLLIAIEKTYGSIETFKQEFSKTALGVFGSGWCWLVKDSQGKLEIIPTSNAANPICEGKTPLLVCDVWEHAYYLDKQNRRADYLDSFWNLVDWKSVSKRY